MFTEPIHRIGTAISETKQQKIQPINLSSRQQEILFILEQAGELKSAEIIAKFENPIPERTLRRDLSALRKLNIIGSRGRGGECCLV